MGVRRDTEIKKKKGRNLDNGSDSSDSGDDDLPGKRLADPIVSLVFDSLTNPASNSFAYIWCLFGSIIVTIYFAALWLESLNGPNKFTGRLNRSTNSMLLTEEQYKLVKVCCQIPLMFDAFMRVYMLFELKRKKSNKKLWNKIMKPENVFDRNLLFADIVGTLPFFAYICILIPLNLDLSIIKWETFRALYRAIEILNCSRILRYVKDVPAMRAIRMTLFKAGQSLLLPIFFFALFNVTAGVAMFFTEPCFDDSNCPWHDLFEASYFTVVSMTTVGYGDQYPVYDTGRFLALIVCFFGVLFVSMPLAIIGNEYEAAWGDVTHEILQAKRARVEEERAKEMQMKAYRTKLESTTLSKTLDKKPNNNGSLLQTNKLSLLTKMKTASNLLGKEAMEKKVVQQRKTTLLKGLTNLADIVKDHDVVKACRTMALMQLYSQTQRAGQLL